MSVAGRKLRRRDTARICRCGYSTPVTSKGMAVNAYRRHVCHPLRRQHPARTELCASPSPAALPPDVVAALEHYTRVLARKAPIVVDAVAVRRFAADPSVHLTSHDRFAVFALLRSRQWSIVRCRRTLRLSWSTTRRYRDLLDAAGITAVEVTP